MESKNFTIPRINLSINAVMNDGEWYFSAQDVCEFTQIATKTNASKWIKNNIPEKWIIYVNPKYGRPFVCVNKSGLYYALCRGKSKESTKFRDSVFESNVIN